MVLGRTGKSVDPGRNVGGLGYADALEYLQGLPQEEPGPRGMAEGQGASAPGTAPDTVGIQVRQLLFSGGNPASESFHAALVC